MLSIRDFLGVTGSLFGTHGGVKQDAETQTGLGERSQQAAAIRIDVSALCGSVARSEELTI